MGKDEQAIVLILCICVLLALSGCPGGKVNDEIVIGMGVDKEDTGRILITAQVVKKAVEGLRNGGKGWRSGMFPSKLGI